MRSVPQALRCGWRTAERSSRNTHQFEWTTGRRPFGNNAETDIWAGFVVSGDENPHSRRRQELDLGEVDDQSGGVLPQGSPDGFFERRRGEHVDDAGDRHDGYPAVDPLFTYGAGGRRRRRVL